MDVIEREGFLAYSTLPSFNRKVDKAKAIIKEAIAIAPSYVAVSWGKDSTVLLHLCQQIKPDILAIYHGHIERDLISNYSETIDNYCQKFSTNLLMLETDDADENMAVKAPYQQYPVCFLGIRGEENKRRKIALTKYGLIHQYQSGKLIGNWRIAPIGWWTWQDVWSYIVANDIPYLKAYDDSIRGWELSRTTDHVSKKLNRPLHFQRLEEFKQTNHVYYDYLRTHYPEVFL